MHNILYAYNIKKGIILLTVAYTKTFFRVFAPLFHLFPQRTLTNVTINIILVQYIFLLQFRATKYKYTSKYSLFNGFAYSTVCVVLALFF